jgi:hypothetical protein
MPSKKTLLPSSKSLAKVLRDASFDPRILGPLSTVIQISDRNYLEKRAMEFVQEAAIVRISGLLEEEYKKQLRMAIRCLALAILKE